jgi:diguanylate cyclase (GGDEF)-like protein
MMKTPLLTNGFSQPAAFSNDDDTDMFDHAPISLWAEDYSALKHLFDQWRRDGITDLRAFLQADPRRVKRGTRAIRVLKVNRRTLSLFGANDIDELIENLDEILREDTLPGFIEEMVQFWNGQTSFSYKKVNYSLSGRRIDTRLNCTILPGHELDWSRVLVSIDDITAEENIRRQLILAENNSRALFENSPVSLWDCDFSEAKRLVDQWRQAGIADLPAYLTADPQRLRPVYSTPPTRRVNRRTLTLFEATNLANLMGNLTQDWRDDMFINLIGAMYPLKPGMNNFTAHWITCTASGLRLDLKVNGTIMSGSESDWSHVLLAMEDITEEEEARRHLIDAEAYARALFEDSPASIWVEDFSAVKQRLDTLRDRGVKDLQSYTDAHPQFVARCLADVKVLDVNRKALTMYGAPNKPSLLVRLTEILREDLLPQFNEELIGLWQGHLRQQREVINYTLKGDALSLVQQFSVMPHHEHDWSQVVIALTDITARKKAEADLEYLHNHDALTGAYNRSFYDNEINRLQRKGPFPVSVIVLDLNGLKLVNDNFGHAAGDALLRRAGDVLNQVDPSCHVIRIGGDEFVVLMPGTIAAQADRVVEKITDLTDENNQRHVTEHKLNFSIGCVTCGAGDPLEAAIKEADRLMYEAKRKYYKMTGRSRRR